LICPNSEGGPKSILMLASHNDSRATLRRFPEVLGECRRSGLRRKIKERRKSHARGTKFSTTDGYSDQKTNCN
jgi:hypothetical protein